MKRTGAWMMAGVLCLMLAACGSKDDAVFVQSVERLEALGGIAPGDRFLAMVVSEHTAEITRDTEKSIAELLVKEGDDVEEGQALFSYDTEELELNYDKKKLELSQTNNDIERYRESILSLERERAGVSGTEKLRYTVEIQTAQVNLKEAELKQKTKQDELKKAEELLGNSTVVSPITGRVQKVNEKGTVDENGKPEPYIVIQKSGSYRVKGVLGELQRGALRENDRVRILSRTNDNAVWTGTVTLVDYENPTRGNNNMYTMASSDEMTTASKYPFYVKLDSTEGLIMGQHLYVERDNGGTDAEGVGISSAFVCYEEDGAAYVWAEKGSKLEKRSVTLGEYDPMTDVQRITAGLSAKDYIAYPNAEQCRPGVPTTHTQPVQQTPVEEGGEA